MVTTNRAIRDKSCITFDTKQSSGEQHAKNFTMTLAARDATQPKCLLACDASNPTVFGEHIELTRGVLP